MRALFASTAGAGHFTPMVPLAAACRAAGHDVAVAAPASFADAVAGAGLAHLPFADAPGEQMGAVFARLPGLPFEEANEVVMREVFAGLDARAALPGVDDAVRTWRPDVIVREPAEFASYVVAERHGVPHVSVAIGVSAVEDFMLSCVDGELRALGAARGSDGVRAAPALSLVPAVLDRPRRGDGAVVRLRYEAPPAAADALPRWGDAEAPLVYVSYGTVTAALGPFADVYPATVAALADRPVRVLVTVGDSGDPATLGPLPDNVRVERFRPQQAVMPVAAAVVGHGGFGTTMTALAHGVPLVVLPLFASDQRANAAAVAHAGAGVALDGGPPPDVGGLTGALDAVLADGSFAAAARRVADEIAALPPVAAGVAALERIGA